MSYKSIHMIQIYKRKNNYIRIEEIESAGENRQTRFNQQQVGTVQGKYQFLSKKSAEEQKFQFLCFAYRYSNRFRLVNTLPGRVSMAFEDKSL